MPLMLIFHLLYLELKIFKFFLKKILKIKNNINQLGRSINGFLVDFIFSMIEMGASNFEEAHERTVFVHLNYQHSRVHYSISRYEKHITCLAFINLCGFFGPPLYAFLRSTLDSEFFNYIDSGSFDKAHTSSDI